MADKQKVNPIPQSLIGFRVYLDGADMLGIADAELPDLAAITAEITGAGIAGKADVPILGHFDSLGLTLNWRTITGNTTILAAPKGHHLELRGSIQVQDGGTGALSSIPLKVVTEAVPKKTGLGKLGTGKAMENSSEFEVLYIKVVLDGFTRIEIDKLNYKCVVEGEDYLKGVRRDLGL